MFKKFNNRKKMAKINEQNDSDVMYKICTYSLLNGNVSRETIFFDKQLCDSWWRTYMREVTPFSVGYKRYVKYGSGDWELIGDCSSIFV